MSFTRTNAVPLPVIVVLALLAGCAQPDDVPRATTHDDLVTLFQEWRAFEAPALVDGVPDYSDRAMAAQHRELAAYQRRLAAIDTTGWPVEHQVDYHLVRAEMNGLDFDHRVRRPWARNPAFYAMIFPSQSDVPAHEGPVIHTWIDLWTYDYPLAPADAADLAARLRTVRPVLEQARRNLVEDAHDLWVGAVRSMNGQVTDLDALAARVAGTSDDLDGAIADARAATEAYRDWLDVEAPSKTGPSGVGKDNYTWYLQQVHLLPYTWEEEVTIARRELARAHAFAAPRGAPQPRSAAAAPHRQRGGVRPRPQRGGHRLHGVPRSRGDRLGQGLHGPGHSGTNRTVHAHGRPAQLLLRGRLPGTVCHATARLSLVRPRPHAGGAPRRARSGRCRCCTTSSTDARRAWPRASRR